MLKFKLRKYFQEVFKNSKRSSCQLKNQNQKMDSKVLIKKHRKRKFLKIF